MTAHLATRPRDASPSRMAAAAPSRRVARVSGPLRSVAIAAALIGSVGLVWEGYKALGRAFGDVLPGTNIPFPVATTDAAMPHVAQIVSALASPASAAGGGSLLSYYLVETSVTLRESLYGMLIGAAIGAVLAVVLREIPLFGRATLPWLIVSQTIPLVALAPIIVVWVGGAGLPSWIAVTVIAAYLSFFPVTLNTLTGLNSADPLHVEFLRSISAPRWRVLVHVRIPSALPSFFTGLRLAATAAVIGAIVGELSAGTGAGIGRAILTAAYYYSLAPANLYAAILVASLAGIVFVQIIVLVEWLTLRKRSS
ncbi:NitT/TauT family transport system permease protein [Microbacterium sp. SORGH_AS 1204]|nr:NitT/TauT family transport system permease protein [Microbacterium sp. SORGH_AS_1204]